MLSVETFSKLFPQAKTPQAWVDALNNFLPQYEINSEDRMTMFLAQCGLECEGFTVLVENLNYSATALLTTWPKHFTTADANTYARQPEKIANRTYANRMGNGDESSGDGWKFRGKGCIQITGRDNTEAFAKSIGKDIDATCAYLLTIDGAIESACWYWKNNRLNAYADAKDVVGCTKAINGDLNGLADRKNLYAKAISLISAA